MLRHGATRRRRLGLVCLATSCAPCAVLTRPLQPYYWSGSLAGKLGRFPPFLVGWVSLVAFLGGLATCSLQAMQQVVSMSQMYHYGFPTPSGKSPAATQNGQFGVAVAILCFGALMSLIPIKHVNRLALASFSWLIMSVVLITIVIPNIAPANAINPLSGQVEALRRTRDFVFATDYNVLSETSQINGMFSPEAALGSRTNANAYTVCNGLLMAQFLILVFDVPSAYTRRAPRDMRS